MTKAEGIRSALVLSTAHMPESTPDFGNCNALEYEFGYVVFVVEEELCGSADWLKPIMRYAKKHNCVLVNFDRDDDPVDEFKNYDW